MRVIADEGRVVWSASDLKAAAECEFAWLRELDARLGRVASVEEPDDAMLARAITLGLAHEHSVLDGYRERHGRAVVEIPETRSSDAQAVEEAVSSTVAALTSADVAVLYQGAFADADFIGFADFIVREPGGWVVQDTKLARTARVTALMQLAAYVDQLHRLGVPTSDRVELILGDGTVSRHLVHDVLPVFRLRRARIRALIADRDVAAGTDGTPLGWGDVRGELDVRACGRCATCEQEVVAQRDLLLVAGMRPVQRERLLSAGVRTIDELAAAIERPPLMNADVFESLRTQAVLQLRTELADAAAPAYEVVSPAALGGMPRPDLGDMFFDFEGDPLYTEGQDGRWGIDYLFGWVDMRESYTALWAHSFAEEKAALVRFLEVVRTIRAAQPSMHIYHYAPYEPTHLAAMAARHGVGEADVDRLLRDGVFVDLYPIVRRALRVGSRSYSIKKLEPLYMGEEVRTSDVQQGDVSIEHYVLARALREDGELAQAQRLFDDLADYNRYDCVSTRRLRDWLVERAREAGTLPSRDIELDLAAYEPSLRAEALRRRADELAADRAADEQPTADETALRLGSAAIDYYPREAKTFWASHFLRLREPVSVWSDTRDVVVVDRLASRIREDWHSGPRSLRRIVELHGEFAPGTSIREGAVQIVYELPAPFPIETSPRWIHAARGARVIEEIDGGVLVEETSAQGMTWDELPIAIAPSPPPAAGAQQGAIDGWADTLLAAGDGFPSDAMTDLLRRRPPRTRSGALPEVVLGDRVDAITKAVGDLDRSYLAVQGPPGTGKTYVGSHVIARLVSQRGFRVGVVAQSHAVVENLLARIIDAGLDRSLVAKQPKDEPLEGEEPPFTVVRRTRIAEYLEQHRVTGCVIGGTAWDFANTARVARDELDLLVIDEAGQFSLASTVAVSVAAKRLLLLGDPQQLPQVSQGTHPEPVDTSALGWVMADHEVLPASHGYFLAESWRMHPAVAASVSDLSYEGKLHAHPTASSRRIDGVTPGVHAITVVHHGNATHSDEEAAEVVRLVRDHVGRSFTPDAGEAERALTEDDVIVVTPYNAQQEVVAAALDAAGFGSVRVGTVDRFQGQEAAIAIVSMAASTARDAPRGLEFLLLQNRINVAISRAQVAAYVLYAPALLDDLPRTPDGVTRLSAFVRLVVAEG